MPLRHTALTDRPIVRYLGRDADAHGRGLAALGRRDSRLAARGPLAHRLHPHPGQRRAPALARRFHDEVRARVPELDALPEPIPVEPLTLF